MSGSATTREQAEWFSQTFDKLVTNVSKALVGKQDVTRLAVTCLLADGHLLLEDVPGTGKTLLARALANTVQGSHSRIQFTPDLLPSDITGVTIFDQRTGTFEFHRGPVFATIVLADEINRASPKTQSALLEVMEEARVTIDGTPHAVARPFMVVATQNPIEQAGTYRLPEAQLDRFLMRTSLGYLEHDATVELLADAKARDRSSALSPLITGKGVMDMMAMAGNVHVDHAVLSYVARIAEQTRVAPEVRLGVSVRGSLALVRAAKAWALAQGRVYVTPDDIKVLTEPVLAHRILLDPEAEFNGASAGALLERIRSEVTPPARRGD